MLSKVFAYSKNHLIQNKNQMVSFTKRGVYKSGTEPQVFVNKYTKVICQGMTGKHVSVSIVKALSL